MVFDREHRRRLWIASIFFLGVLAYVGGLVHGPDDNPLEIFSGLELIGVGLVCYLTARL